MRATRKPTGVPAWPWVLLTGPEKTGKTLEAARATGSDLVGHSYWLGCGEPDPDEYGPVGDWEFLSHNGSHRDMLSALTEASAEPRGDGKPTLLVVDSIGRWWDLLSDMAQAEANDRAKAKAARSNRPEPEEDVVIGTDLWNVAKQRWNHLLDTLRMHNGPVIVTARLENIVVVDNDGQPTRDRVWKVKAEKNLPHDVNTVIQVHQVGQAYLTGTKSLRLRPDLKRPLPWFQEVKDLADMPRPSPVESVWAALGMSEAATATFRPASASQAQRAEERLEQERRALLEQIQIAAQAAGVTTSQVAAAWERDHGGRIDQTTDLGLLELVRDDLLALPGQMARDEQESQRAEAERQAEYDRMHQPAKGADDGTEG